jgi:hypothetical protein
MTEALSSHGCSRATTTSRLKSLAVTMHSLGTDGRGDACVHSTGCSPSTLEEESA